jgi:hypothetical protein
MTWYVLDKREYLDAGAAVGVACRDVIGRHHERGAGRGIDGRPGAGRDRGHRHRAGLSAAASPILLG